jgi:hypothetical protein
VEWHRYDSDLEIEVSPEGVMGAWYRDSQADSQVEFGFSFDATSFSRLRRLYEAIDRQIPHAA